jgi:copper transporter 1
VASSYAKADGDLVETAVGSNSLSTVILVLKSRCRIDAILSKRFIRLNRSASSQQKGSTDDGDAGRVTRESSSPQPRAPALSLRNAAPFVPAHDLARGVMMIFQTAINYTLMLVVMYAVVPPSLPPTDNIPIRTFNAGLIISILLGLGVGEVAFGRFAYVTSHGH